MLMVIGNTNDASTWFVIVSLPGITPINFENFNHQKRIIRYENRDRNDDGNADDESLVSI